MFDMKADRLGRTFANGQFELTEWIGSDFLMGIAIARELQTGQAVRLTFAADVSRTAEQLRPILTPDIPGLAPVLYLGPMAADDGWGGISMLMAEALPAGEQFDPDVRAGDADAVASFGARLTAHVARIHRSGVGLGTMRPEGTFVSPTGEITLVTRGERLWYMPRPNMTKPGMLPPWRLGYLAPELYDGPIFTHPGPAADVYSIGVMLSSWLLGRFPFEGEAHVHLYLAQRQGKFVELPSTPLGELLGRCMLPAPAARPSLDELAHGLGAEQSFEPTFN